MARGPLYHPPVQLDLPFLRAALTPALGRSSSTALVSAVSEPLRHSQASELSFEYVRVLRARRYIVRVRPDGIVRVTVPRGGSRAEAVRFVEQHLSWIDRERVRVRTASVPRVWADGTTILLHGEPVEIQLLDTADGRRAVYSDRGIRIPAGASDLRPFIERDLRALAHDELPSRVSTLASQHGLSVGRVTIRNQRSRWGSCSPTGCIALNFRLIQMPAFVCNYVLLHELMHVRHPNHSVRFWRLVERVCPEFREAERWLKTEGRKLL